MNHSFDQTTVTAPHRRQTVEDVEAEIRKARIVIVDDEPMNVSLLESVLTGDGYLNTLGVTDPRRVAGLYGDEPIDLLLLDIRMPYLDGYQVMEGMAERIAIDDMIVMVLTAQADVRTRLKALDRGARDFVTKPFHPGEVLSRIRNMLETQVLHRWYRRRNEFLEAEVGSRTRELEATRLEVIHRLGRAAEYRDNETGLHVIRMSQCCQQLALAAGLGEGHGEAILHASPMHDVGKIGIPDKVLLKPGALTSEEWTLMMTHATIGGDLLAGHDSEILKMASMIALTHHEKWDGTGYPAGLKAEDIPLEGRITAICDVFDALTSERPYKKPWPVAAAVAFLESNEGSHFDAALVACFKDILPAVEAISARYADPPPADLSRLVASP